MADDWLTDDPFLDPTDPEAVERAKRRREREERRREREQAEAAKATAAKPPEPEPAPPPPPAPAQPEQPAPELERQQPPARRPEPPAATPPPAPAPPPDPIPPAPEQPDPTQVQPAAPAQSTPPPAPRRQAQQQPAAPPPQSGTPAEPPPPPRTFEQTFWDDDEEPEAERPKRRNVRRAGGRGLALLLLIIPLALVAWLLLSLFQPFHGEGTGEVRVEIPQGASVGEVGDVLDDAGVVSSSAFFEARVTLAGKRDELYPGNYTLAKDMSYSDAIDAISTPPVSRVINITIPEGLSRSQVAPILRDAGVSGNYLEDSVAYGNFDPGEYGAENPENLEGFLFPATYELPAKGTTRQLVARQLDAFKQRIAGVDLSYAKSKNLTAYDVLIIASMIEREVQIPEERRLVSAVIYNRLRDDIPLGIDATIRFAVDNYTEPLTVSQLETDSPYNTRLNLGLPPGPIGNPGQAALEAAANPADVDYRYYVVKPGTCGEHSFSETFAEFSQDADEYAQAQEEAGGSPDTC